MSKIITWPNEILSKVSKEVDALTIFQSSPIEIKDIVEVMFAVMREQKGIGLSAIQIGVPLRIFVMDCSNISQFDKNQMNIQPAPMVCINPMIVDYIGDPIEMTEGCLSFPGIFEKVMRHNEVILKCEDLTGLVSEYQLTGIEAQCAQHEMDHLDGITFATNWGRVKKDIVKRKIAKALK